jgi:NDP-sugar pyrophosphorylase family protein
MIQIIIPMAGRGSRFKSAGFLTPKPMIEIHGLPMIEWALKSFIGLSIPHEFFFIAQKQDLDHGLLKILENKGTIIPLDDTTEGAVSSVLAAESFINGSNPLLISNCDQFINWNINNFIAKSQSYDASLVVFRSRNEHHSYILQSDKKITLIEEKKTISDLAVGGIYFCQRSLEFFKFAKILILKDLRVRGEFYISPVFNEMIIANKILTSYEVPANLIHMLGTPEEVRNFENTHNFNII